MKGTEQMQTVALADASVQGNTALGTPCLHGFEITLFSCLSCVEKLCAGFSKVSG